MTHLPLRRKTFSHDIRTRRLAGQMQERWSLPKRIALTDDGVFVAATIPPNGLTTRRVRDLLPISVLAEFLLIRLLPVRRPRGQRCGAVAANPQGAADERAPLMGSRTRDRRARADPRAGDLEGRDSCARFLGHSATRKHRSRATTRAPPSGGIEGQATDSKCRVQDRWPTEAKAES